jgi:GNAT superfamily N-acetyltransferase
MWANGNEATVEDLFVDPAVRKQGIGSSLMEFALARAQSTGCTTACLDTNEFNVASTKIYSALGFSSTSKRWNGRQLFFRKEIQRLSSGELC